MMHSLILLFLFSSISIHKMSGDKLCIEQQCVSSISQWCCPYNTTCGNQNACNQIKQARSQSYCTDRLACSSDRFYWCCNNDQTCGSFRECEGRSATSLGMIVIFSTIGAAVLITICGIYTRRRWLRNNNNTQASSSLPHDNEGLPPPFYLLTNSSMSEVDSREQFSNISPPYTTFLDTEEPPPSYNAAVASLTTQNQDKV